MLQRGTHHDGMRARPRSDAGNACLLSPPRRSESDVNALRSEVHEVLGSRNVADEKFQAVVLDELAGLKVRVRAHAWLVRACLRVHVRELVRELCVCAWLVLGVHAVARACC